jgi:LPPG:FO 2-phospho-L-lactate transferase
MVVALCGGVGAARLLRGMEQVVGGPSITAVVNTGDDTELFGLHVSPDLDTVMYTLAGLVDDERGWGLANETWTVMDALDALGGPTWFRLGDRDLATHCYRTGRLAAGATLSEVTAELCRSFGVGPTLLPVSDDRIRTVVTLRDGGDVPFQDYFVRLRHAVPVSGIRFDGAGSATPGQGVLGALEAAATIVVCPSNPVVSIGPLLAVPGVLDVLRRRRDRVVGVSPLVGGAALKGPADRMLVELGGEATSAGVARGYADWMGTLVIDTADAGDAPSVEAAGLRCVVAPTVMRTPDAAARLSEAVLASLDGP